MEPAYTYTLTHKNAKKKKNGATYRLYIVYHCEEAACSWRQLNQQEKPDVTQQPFSFLCEDIVRELLEGQKTGHSTVETAFVLNAEVYMYGGK